jgi:hypothetical protein
LHADTWKSQVPLIASSASPNAAVGIHVFADSNNNDVDGAPAHATPPCRQIIH